MKEIHERAGKPGRGTGLVDRRRPKDELAVLHEVARWRSARLQELTAALSRAATRQAVADVLVQQAFDPLEAQAAAAWFVQPDGTLQLAAARGLSESRTRELARMSPDAEHPAAAAVRDQAPVWLESLEALRLRFPALRYVSTPESKQQAAAAIPLLSQERVLGVVAFTFGKPRQFDEDDRTFLLTLANHAAVAAERSQLRQEEVVARNRLVTLAEASRSFSMAKLELRDTLDVVAREVAHRLRETCAVMLLSPDEQVLEPVAITSVDLEFERSVRKTIALAPVRMSEGSLPARVATTGEPLLLPDLSLEQLLAVTVRPEYGDHHRRFPIRSMLVVPLRARGKIIGVIMASRGPASPPFGPDDLTLLQELADRAALAIANARQHEELELERRRLDVLAKASEVFAQTLDYETTLRNAISLALPALGDFGFFDVREPGERVRRVALAYQDPERQALLDQTRWIPAATNDPVLCALTSGSPGFHPVIDDAWLRRLPVEPENLAFMRRLGFSSMLTVPLSARGTVVGALTLFYTARHHTRADLRLAEELALRAAAALENARLFREAQQAAALRDEFLAIAGHELNTPLAALKLHIQSLERLARKEPQLPPAFSERLAKTDGLVGRLEKLIDELLDVSRITVGRFTLVRAPMDLAAAVADVVDRLAPRAAEAGSRLVLDLKPGVQGTWDPLRIEQVVTNLLGNAIKYGQGQPIELTVDAAAGLARLTVRDHGIGISPEDEQRVFGRFERAVSVRHYGGLGLGLWISRQIVEAHGGTIRFERPSDAGTRFIVELPV